VSKIRIHPARRLSRLLLGAVVSVTLLATGAPVRALEASGFTYTADGGSATVTGCVGTCPTNLVIPATLGGNAVRTIGDEAFRAKALVSVTIPSSVTSIGYYAFKGNRLTSVTIPNSVTSIGEAAFYYNRISNVTISTSLTLIGREVFRDNLLTSVTIPSSVTTIGTGAFMNNLLTSVTIPSSVTTIGNGAFLSNRLTRVTIPNTVTVIGGNAFASNSLASVTIPSSIESIEEWAFYGNALTSVAIPNSVTNIGFNAFAGNRLATVSIPGSVVTIGEGAFSDNSLRNVTIPGTVASVGQNAFAGNPLASVTILDGVVTIGNWAFNDGGITQEQGLTGVVSVTIPDSVTTIGDGAFGVSGLVTVVFEGDSPTSGTDVFVPTGYVATGAAAFAPPETAAFSSVFGHAGALVHVQRAITTATKRKNLSVMRVWRKPSASGWSSTWGGVQVVTIGGSPIALVKPTLRGTSTVGKTLTAVKGTWTGYPAPTIRYQWYACTKAVTAVRTSVPSTCKKITGATRSTFKLTSAQRAKYVTVLVTGTSAGTTATTWLSNTTSKIR
jgi:hypothetical protein